jgi:hypothetical protein
MTHLFLIRETYNKTFTSGEYPESYPEEKLYPSGPKRAGFCIKGYLLVGDWRVGVGKKGKLLDPTLIVKWS